MHVHDSKYEALLFNEKGLQRVETNIGAELRGRLRMDESGRNEWDVWGSRHRTLRQWFKACSGGHGQRCQPGASHLSGIGEEPQGKRTFDSNVNGPPHSGHGTNSLSVNLSITYLSEVESIKKDQIEYLILSSYLRVQLALYHIRVYPIVLDGNYIYVSSLIKAFIN